MINLNCIDHGWMDVAIMTNRVMVAVKCKTMLVVCVSVLGLFQIVHKLSKYVLFTDYMLFDIIKLILAVFVDSPLTRLLFSKAGIWRWQNA